MYEAFEKLPEEKRNRILAVCIEAFAETGYEKTSTDMITKRAGISKGILFHYFKNKKNLYVYVIKHVHQFLAHRILSAIEQVQSADFFDRIKEVILIKQRIQFEHLQETKLVTHALLHPPHAVREEMLQLLQQNKDLYGPPFLAKMLDASLLKEHVSPDRVLNLTMIVLEQVTQQYLKLLENNELSMEAVQEQLIPELDAYMDMIRYGVYQEPRSPGPAAPRL
ncbi:TetR/AcrR family transcriptional regulator [Marinicrinis sediminis]|uniref:TetR/AcrR family transcriptional regulator n=1 Tax=Marinicrinis sediminis TaxID=1652465 RepID=A0ABW5R833_9BACL